MEWSEKAASPEDEIIVWCRWKVLSIPSRLVIYENLIYPDKGRQSLFRSQKLLHLNGSAQINERGMNFRALQKLRLLQVCDERALL